MCDEDTKSSFNFDCPDDVEEVAVYGTQAACGDYEEFAVTVKEEELDDNLDIISLEYQTPNNIMSNILLNNFTVYTTRLDHMQAFNKIEMHDTKEITEMILKESKPRLKQTAVPNKVEPMNADITTYVKLNCLVHQINTKVKAETSRRNEKLLRLCKPLKIVLNDIRTHIKTRDSTDNDVKNYLNEENSNNDNPFSMLLVSDVSHIKAEPNKIQTDDDAVNNLSEDTSDDEPLSILSTNALKEKVLFTYNFYATTAVAIKDKRAQELDLYIVNPNVGIKSYYRTTRDKCAYLQELHKSQRQVFLEYCCWVNREKLIKCLGGLSRLSMTYMRTRHNCLPRLCSCCCVSGDLPNRRGDGGLNLKFMKNTSNVELTAPISSNKIIEKALNFVRPNADVRQDPILAKPYCLKNAVIIIKYHEIMFSQTEILGENYEIGIGGDVINYVRPTVNRSIKEEKEIYQKLDKPDEPRIYISSLVCCWHCREGIIAQLRETSYVLPSTLRFIKTPHLCKVAKCICCCKPRPSKNFALRKEPIVGSNKNKDNAPLVSRLKQNHDWNRMPVYFNEYRNEINMRKLRKSQAELKATQQRESVNKLKQTNKSTTKTTIDLTARSFRNNITLVPNTKHQTEVNPDTNRDPAHQSVTYTSLTTSFLNKIKDFKVTVNENGKLSAVINAPQGQMPAADIKMISDVLLLASEQIKALGIAPQEFCNRVNKSKSMNGLNSILRSGASTKTSSTPGFTMPNTRDVNAVCSIYQMMSSIGGKKNRLLVEAYKIHFGEKIGVVNAPSSYMHQHNSNKNWDPPKINKGSSITNDKPNTVEPVSKQSLKRRITQTDNKPTLKKNRHVSVVRLPEPVQLKNGENGTENFSLQKISTNGGVPHSATKINMSTQNLIDSIVPTFTANNTPLQNISKPYLSSTHPLKEDSFKMNPNRPLSGVIPQTDRNTETPIIVGDNFDDDPGPNLEDVVFLDSDVMPISSVNKPANYGVSHNPLLHNMLTQTATPCPTKMGQKSIKTLIKEHPKTSNEPKLSRKPNKKRRMCNGILSSVIVDEQVNSEDEPDLETLLKTTVIPTKNNDEITNPIIITQVINDDEVEGIFGV